MTKNALTEDTKAVILLCGVLGRESRVKPLGLVEYNKLVQWLVSVGKRPCDLLQMDIGDAAAGSSLDKDRLKLLLERGVLLGVAVEEWQRSGVWVISRSDADYPLCYKKHLKGRAPPLLFGVGDILLLQKEGGLCIVGSRAVDKAGEDFTRQMAVRCVRDNMTVVSGGARGVDSIAINTALAEGGVSIGIVAENLLKKSVERPARDAIADGRLLLLSPYHPAARFSVGAAMGRNKLIYAAADYGLVVSAEYQKGGTWAGAVEERRRENPKPVFVRIDNTAPNGNSKLLELGIGITALPALDDNLGLKQQLEKAVSTPPDSTNTDNPQQQLSLA